MNGKYIDRLIEDTNQRKEVNGTKYSWMFFKSDAIPYVLTKRAIEVGFIPPYLVSALPKIVEQKVPEQFHYWKSKNRSERMAKREELITHMKKTNLKFESWTPSKPEPVVEKFESVVCVKAESMTFDKAVDMGNDGLPKFLEVSGILFYPGVHRSSSGVARGYSSQSLKTAKLMAGKNMNLAYINWYHMKDEPYRAGILTDIWWDQNTKVEHAGEQGCLKYRGFIFHRDAIAEVWNSRTKNVSAELSFNTLGKYEGVPSASDICVTGMAMTSSPALPNADIGEICTIDNEGKRSCSRVE
jgi:hypothetical protein